MNRPVRPTAHRLRRLLLPVLAGTVLAAGTLVASPVALGTPSARAGYAEGNPLAGRPWGVYQGRGDQAWQPYAAATGPRKQLLATIALRPRAKWFGAWIPNAQVANKVRAYVAASQAGDPEALVQLTLFAMKPWEHDACRRLPTAAERASYADWTSRVAGAIGEAHAAVVLQPDGPFALCAPGGSTVPSSMIAAAARRLSALPHTSVYIEAGAADWPAAGRQGGVAAAVRLLVQGGIRATRGFALNGTHYSSTADEVARGTAIVEALAARGIPGKHFVVNTSSNGHPFTFGSYTGPDPDNASVCRTRSEPAARTCVTLGIPPTTEVADPRWGLPEATRDLAAQHVDGYLWFGRPWLYRQADPFVMARALRLAASTPY